MNGLLNDPTSDLILSIDTQAKVYEGAVHLEELSILLRRRSVDILFLGLPGKIHVKTV